MVSLQYTLPNDDSYIPITPRAQPDLSGHVVSFAYWYRSKTRPHSYLCKINKQSVPIEFINNQWCLLTFFNHKFHIRRSQFVDRKNTVNLGWWKEADPQNPDRVEPTQIASTSRGFGLCHTSNSNSLSESAHTPPETHEDAPRPTNDPVDKPLEYIGKSSPLH